MIMRRYFNINYSLTAHLGHADVSEWRAEPGQVRIPESKSRRWANAHIMSTLSPSIMEPYQG